VKKNVVLTAAAVLTLAAGAPAMAQSPSATPNPAPMSVVPQQPAFVTPGARVDLTIEEAVARSREKNIDIAVARITPRLTDFSIAGLEANYRFNLTSQANNARVSTLPSQTTQGITTVTTSMTQNWSGGIAKNLYRGGGNYQVNFTNARRNSPSSTNFRNPQFTSGVTFNVTQPVLRGFKIDSTRAA